MIHTASLSLLLLLLAARSTRAITLEETIRVEKIYRHYLAAFESLPDGSFAYCEIDEPADNRHTHLDLVVAKSNSRDNHTRCSFDLDSGTDASMLWLSSLRRIGQKKLLCVGYEEFYNGTQHGLMVAYDLRDCEATSFYSGPRMPVDSKIVTSLEGDVHVFMPSDALNGSCESGIVRAIFDKELHNFECFDVDLLWQGIHFDLQASENGKFNVRGFDTSGAYKFLSYDAKTNRPKELFSLRNATNQTEFASSEDALCYILNPGVDKTIHCAVFLENEANYIKTLSYEEPVGLRAVSLLQNPKQLIVIATDESERAKECINSHCGDAMISYTSLETNSTETLTLNFSQYRDIFEEQTMRVIGIRRKSNLRSIVMDYVCDMAMEALIFNTMTIKIH